MKNGIVTRGVLYDVPSRAVLRKDPFRRSVLITTKHRRDFGDFRQEPRSYTIHLVSLDIAKARGTKRMAKIAITIQPANRFRQRLLSASAS